MSGWLRRLVGSSVRKLSAPVGAMNDAYDKQTFAVMRRWLRQESWCIDVGCHRGAVLEEMLRLAPAGRHHAFEPIPELYRKLVSSFPEVSVFDVALSDTAGEASFQHVVSNPGYSGLRRRVYDRPHETVREITVTTGLLDDFIADDAPIALVKVDVEGAELQVLRGAVQTIRRSKPVVVFEHGVGAADCYGTTPEQVYDFLNGECGLRISLMEDWLRGDRPLSREALATEFYEGTNYYFMAHP